MQATNFVIEVSTDISQSPRVRQLEALFDCPAEKKARLRWTGSVDFARPWQIGLIVGPSGSGKSTILQHLFPSYRANPFVWSAPSVLDDFAKSLTMTQISEACQAVGFNTIPAWMRPFKVLSNGEQFRVSLARSLLETPDDEPIVLDEFTSVVDRQVAQIGAYAVQRYIRRHPNPHRQFVAASCHNDIIEWLNPDWTLNPATHENLALEWRQLDTDPKAPLHPRDPKSPDQQSPSQSAASPTTRGRFLHLITI